MGQQVETVLKALDTLDDNELQIVYENLINRLRNREVIIKLFNKYAGKGKGVWPKDAQQIISELRQE